MYLGHTRLVQIPECMKNIKLYYVEATYYFYLWQQFPLSSICIPTVVFPLWYPDRQRFLSAVANSVEGFRCYYSGGGSSEVYRSCQLGELVGKGMAKIGLWGVEGFDTSRGFIAGLGVPFFQGYYFGCQDCV